jgi:heme exporter protein A
MIELTGVCKSFGHQVALRDVTLSVTGGERVTLIGPNGAGKTTLLRILATLTRPTSGTVRVAGLDPAQDRNSVRRQIGFLSHQTLLYDDLTSEQNLRFYARMYGLRNSRDRIIALLERVGLAARRQDLVKSFSRGMKQRLAVARAVLHRPQLLLLDEPFAGLDVHATEMLTALLDEMANEGTTTVLATHSLDRAMAVGRRVVVVHSGRVVHDERNDTLNKAALSKTYRSATS